MKNAFVSQNVSSLQELGEHVQQGRTACCHAGGTIHVMPVGAELSTGCVAKLNDVSIIVEV